MRDWRVILGKNVRRLRQQKGLTQEELAFEAKIDLTYMGGIERGKRNPSLLLSPLFVIAILKSKGILILPSSIVELPLATGPSGSSASVMLVTSWSGCFPR